MFTRRRRKIFDGIDVFDKYDVGRILSKSRSQTHVPICWYMGLTIFSGYMGLYPDPGCMVSNPCTHLLVHGFGHFFWVHGMYRGYIVRKRMVGIVLAHLGAWETPSIRIIFRGDAF